VHSVYSLSPYEIIDSFRAGNIEYATGNLHRELLQRGPDAESDEYANSFATYIKLLLDVEAEIKRPQKEPEGGGVQQGVSTSDKEHEPDLEVPDPGPVPEEQEVQDIERVGSASGIVTLRNSRRDPSASVSDRAPTQSSHYPLLLIYYIKITHFITLEGNGHVMH
jgi:hypothetical protein